MYPDLCHATVRGEPALDLVGLDWVENEFMPTVQKRGAAIIEARGGRAFGLAPPIPDWRPRFAPAPTYLAPCRPCDGSAAPSPTGC